MSKKPDIEKRLPRYDLALWYSSKAKEYLRAGNRLFQGFRYPECISTFGTAIEFASKAICTFLGAKYKPEHDLSRPLTHLSTQFTTCKTEFSRTAWISSRWVGANQQTRLLASYGNQEAGVPATKFIGKHDVALIKADAEEACAFLNFIETKQKFGIPRKIGILNGYVDEEDPTEKPCNKYTFSEFTIEDWEKRFSKITDAGKTKFKVEKIPISKVNSEYAVVVNPFGEIYPEKDVKNRFVFNHLKNYVDDGGVLVNVAGFPFFYAWNVLTGAEEPIVDEKMLVPESIRAEGGTFYVDRYKTLLNFVGSLAWRDLGIITTSDTPKVSGIREVEVYQKKEDKEIGGDIVNVGKNNKVNEFRAVRKDLTKDAVPILRTKRADFGEVYPIASIKRGFGYIIVCGMHTKSTSEFEKIVTAIDNFCGWLFKKSSPNQ